MPKSKPTAKKKNPSRKGTRGAKSKARRSPVARRKPAPGTVTEEYSDYIVRYELNGEDRPKLSPSEFNRLDEELLDLLALQGEQGNLSDDEIIRLQELEYLLLDEQSDSTSF